MTTSDSRVTDEMVEKACLVADHASGLDEGTFDTLPMRAALEAVLSAQAPSVALADIQSMLDEHEGGPRRRNEQSFDLGYFDGYRDALSNLISKAGRDE